MVNRMSTANWHLPPPSSVASVMLTLEDQNEMIAAEMRCPPVGVPGGTGRTGLHMSELIL